MKQIITKMPAPNARFGATAAVTPLKMACGHERKYPAERLVSAAASPSHHHVGSNPGEPKVQTLTGVRIRH